MYAIRPSDPPASPVRSRDASHDTRITLDAIYQPVGYNVHMPKLTTLDGLKQRCLIAPSTGCWEFQGCRNTQGYGQVAFLGGMRQAHRVSYTLAIGAIPEGLHVLHHCDNPCCCNPDHLWLGTDKGNSDDKIRKGRYRGPPSGDSSFSRQHPERLARGERHGSKTKPHRCPRGERNGGAKLTESQVSEIIVEYSRGKISQLALGKKYGVSQQIISAIVRKEVWAHVSSIQ